MAACQSLTEAFAVARDTYHSNVKTLEEELGRVKDADRLRELECGAKGFDARTAAAAEAYRHTPTYAVPTGRHCAPLAHGPARRMSVTQCEDWCDADSGCTGFVREGGSCRLLAVPIDSCSGTTSPTPAVTYERAPPSGPRYSHACLGPSGTRLTHGITACDRQQSAEACSVFEGCTFDGVHCRPKECTTFRRLVAPVDVTACKMFMDPACAVLGTADEQAEATFVDAQVASDRREAMHRFGAAPEYVRATGASDCALKCREGCAGFVVTSDHRCQLIPAERGTQIFKRK